MGGIDLFREKSRNLNMFAGLLISCSVTLSQVSEERPFVLQEQVVAFVQSVTFG